jgi:hypothetical protein
MLSITPDQLASAGGHIARMWGDYGYRIEAIESPTRAVSLFHVCASDGSRFIVPIDKWGNAGEAVDSHGYETPERTEALSKVVREMHARAVAP